MATFYHYEFEREPFYLVKGVVLDTAEELLRDSPSWSERREEFVAVEAGDEPSGEASLQRPWMVLTRASSR